MRLPLATDPEALLTVARHAHAESDRNLHEFDRQRAAPIISKTDNLRCS